jgi:hypothetical protein
MRYMGLTPCLLLLAASCLWAQSQPYPAAHNTPSSRQGPSAFSQSTIQGCLMGSEETSSYVLTDEHTGEIYLLQGNDSLLKEQVGHEVLMTGVAYPLRPSDKKGKLGYISPSAPHRTATSDQAGQKAMNFNFTDIQPVANRCTQETESERAAIAASQAALGSVNSDNPQATEPHVGYEAQKQTQNQLVGCVSGSASDLLLAQPERRRNYRLQGNTAELKNDLGKMVRVTGQLLPGTGPSIAHATQPAPLFRVTAIEVMQDYCSSPPTPAGRPPVAVGGKSGNEGDASLVSDTSSVGQTTPGYQTQSWKAQAPGPHTGIAAGGMPQARNHTATQGVPPNPELTAQNPAAAERIASSAERAELDNPQRQLGVNAQPNYSLNGPQASQQANQELMQAGGQSTSYPQNQNSESNTRLPGASQHIHAPQQAQRHKEEEAAEHHQPVPTLIGCLTAPGKSSHEFYLTEQKTGARYRLNGTREELKDHINHLVELAGKYGMSEAAAKSVAGSKQAEFYVTGVRDLAPTCGARR